MRTEWKLDDSADTAKFLDAIKCIDMEIEILLQNKNNTQHDDDKKSVKELLDVPYEMLDDEEKERRRLLGYRPEDKPIIKYDKAGLSSTKPTEYTDLAKPKDEDITLRPENPVIKNYFGIDFDALARDAPKHEHNHGQDAEKDTHYMIQDPNVHDHKHDAKIGYEEHGDAGHFHSDGTYHAAANEDSGHGKKGHSYQHDCGGCNPGYAGKAIFSAALPLFIPRAA